MIPKVKAGTGNHVDLPQDSQENTTSIGDHTESEDNISSSRTMSQDRNVVNCGMKLGDNTCRRCSGGRHDDTSTSDGSLDDDHHPFKRPYHRPRPKDNRRCKLRKTSGGHSRYAMSPERERNDRDTQEHTLQQAQIISGASVEHHSVTRSSLKRVPRIWKDLQELAMAYDRIMTLETSDSNKKLTDVHSHPSSPHSVMWINIKDVEGTGSNSKLAYISSDSDDGYTSYRERVLKRKQQRHAFLFFPIPH